MISKRKQLRLHLYTNRSPRDTGVRATRVGALAAKSPRSAAHSEHGVDSHAGSARHMNHPVLLTSLFASDSCIYKTGPSISMTQRLYNDSNITRTFKNHTNAHTQTQTSTLLLFVLANSTIMRKKRTYINSIKLHTALERMYPMAGGSGCLPNALPRLFHGKGLQNTVKCLFMYIIYDAWFLCLSCACACSCTCARACSLFFFLPLSRFRRGAHAHTLSLFLFYV